MPTDPKAEHADTELEDSKKGAANDGDTDFDDALSTVESRRKTAADRAREAADTTDNKGGNSPAARKAIAALDDALEDLEEVSPKSAKALKAWAKGLVEGLGERDKELDGVKGIAGFKDLLPRVAALTNTSENKSAREAHRALDAIAGKGLAKQFGANRAERMADDTVRNRCIELLRDAKELQEELEDQGKDLSLKDVVEKLAKKRFPGKLTEGKADTKADQLKRAAGAGSIAPGRTNDGKFVAKGSEASRLAVVDRFVNKRKTGG